MVHYRLAGPLPVKNPVQTVTVVGAGPEGRYISGLAAQAGYRTILEDITGQTTVDDPRIKIERALDRAAAEADLVIEAVPDDLETKTEVYTILDLAAQPHCLFATVSQVPVAEIASLTYRPSKVLGIRFSPESGLIEVVAGPHTSTDALASAQEVANRLLRAKEPLWNVKT